MRGETHLTKEIYLSYLLKSFILNNNSNRNCQGRPNYFKYMILSVNFQKRSRSTSCGRWRGRTRRTPAW